MPGRGRERAGGVHETPRDPVPLNEQVRAQMQRMPDRNTKPEVQLRKELFRRGLRFRVNVKELPGSPDIVFPRARIAVFVDGCYW